MEIIVDINQEVSGIVSDLVSSASTQGLVSALKVALIIIIFASIAGIIIVFIYRIRKYNIDCIIRTLRDGRYIKGRDKLGIFKKKEVYYAKLWKRKLKIEIPNFEAMIKDRGYPDLLLLTQVGVGSFYQVKILDDPQGISDKAIDHNIIRLASMQLREDNAIYSSHEDFLDKYGIYIAWVFMIIIFAIAQYLNLRKEGQILDLAGKLIETTKGYQDAVINKATILIPAGLFNIKKLWRMK